MWKNLKEVVIDFFQMRQVDADDVSLDGVGGGT
jgi:hypothetical protein